MDQQQNQIISLIAVFWALGIGILIGASMGEKALVLHQLAFIEELKGEIMHYKEEINNQFASFSRLQEELLLWESLEEKYLNSLLIENKLQDVVIKVIALEGIGTGLENFLIDSGSAYQIFVYTEASREVPFFIQEDIEIYILSGPGNPGEYLTAVLENIQQQGMLIIRVTEDLDEEIALNVTGDNLSFPTVNRIEKFYNKVKLLELIQEHLRNVGGW